MYVPRTYLLTICTSLLLLSQGLQAEPGVTPKEILIGQTVALNGSTGEHGRAVVLGAKAYLDKVNAAGGIQGRRIILKTLDDGGNSGQAGENTRKLIEGDGVLAVFGGIEGGPCEASMKVATERKVPLVACMAGSPALREPFSRYVFPVRAPHFNEFEKFIETALQFGQNRIAFLHTDNANGQKHLANVKKLLAERKTELTLALPISSGAEKPDAAKLAQQLIAAKVDTVFNHGGYGLYAQVIKEVRARGGNIQFMAVNSGSHQLVQLLGTEARGLILTQVMPSPTSSTLPIVKEYREVLKKAVPNAEYSFSSLEGYISARALVEGLHRAGAKLSREQLVTAMEEMENVDLGGFHISYTKARHQGAVFVDILVVGADGRIFH